MMRNQSIKLMNSGFIKASMNELPVPIIHHILSFLPDDEEHQSVTKQVTRLSLVSKWWQHACSSYPVLGFSERCYYNEIPNHLKKIQQFIGFVDKTMNRHRDDRIQKLKLRIDFDIFWNERYIGDDLSLFLDKWINIGLENQVPYLELRVRVRYVHCDNRANRYEFRYHMPHRVVSSNTIKSLLLGWQVSLPRNWEDHPHHLSSTLHSLELHQLQHLDKIAFQTLIKACTTIQTLTVDTQLEEINIWGLNHLKMATIRRRYVNDITNNFKLMINAPSLDTLCLSELGYGSDTFEHYYPSSIHLDCCHKESLEGKKLVPTHLPACKIDNLNLNITAHSSSSYAVILSRLFSTFHPTTLQMSFIDNDNGQCRNFLQVVCEILSNRGKVSSCSDCFGHFKCWKHQLEDVKVQSIKGPNENGNIAWGTMLKQLSTLTANHQICFKLQWTK